MHLLLAQKGAIDEGGEAIDLGQAPADFVFLSAADTELSSVGEAHVKDGCDAFSVRIANLMQLSHPMSVDVYVDKTIARSRLVVVRVLGGVSYWSYGLEKLLETALDHAIKLVVLPGDDKPDPGLAPYCTVDAAVCDRIWGYLKEGGPQNAAALIAYAKQLLGWEMRAPDPTPLLKAGIWYPGIGISSLECVRERWVAGQPVVGITFYRALVQANGLQPIERMVEALRDRSINALPMFVTSLKDPVSVATLEEVLSQVNVGLVLNATGFAVSSPGATQTGTPLDAGGADGAADGAWQRITRQLGQQQSGAVDARSGNECGASGD